MTSEVELRYRRVMSLEPNKQEVNGRIFYGRYNVEVLQPTEVQYIDVKQTVKLDVLQYNDEELLVREAGADHTHYLSWHIIYGMQKIPDA